MNRTRMIWAALLIVLVIASIYAMSDPQQAAKLAQARRDAQFSPEMKDVLMGLIAVAIGGYLAWYTFIRKPEE